MALTFRQSIVFFLVILLAACAPGSGTDFSLDSLRRVNSANATPGFKTVIPWIKDDMIFYAFLKKYEKSRVLTQQERLEALIQLGIYNYAPEWLKPDTRKKVEKLLSDTQKLQSPIPIKKAGLKSSFSILVSYEVSHSASPYVVPHPSESYPKSAQASIAAEALLLPIIFLNPATIAAGINAYQQTIAWMQLHDTNLQQLDKDMTPTAAQNLEKARKDYCVTNQCGSVDKPEASGEESGGPSNCDEQYRRQLQNLVNGTCKPPAPRCRTGNSCGSITQRVVAFSSCAEARQKINITCYGGGDRGHQIAYTSARQDAAICSGMLGSCRKP